MPVLNDPMHASLTRWLQHLPRTLLTPTAILVVSAHWEEATPTITSGTRPDLIYDYYGFPPEAYQLKYPAPGNPALAERVFTLLQGSSFHPTLDATRGFDHGVFIPLLLAYPAATVPVVALSLLRSRSAEAHIRLGEALAPLRDEGVLIIGSGLSFHNLPVLMAAMRGGGGGSAVQNAVDPRSKAFDDYLHRVLLNKEASYEEKREGLIGWDKAPSARYAHPSEEHLLPLMVAFGAGKGEGANAVYAEPLGGAAVSSFQFG
jgi:4,5-DOPA dioxygenase extradiol